MTILSCPAVCNRCNLDPSPTHRLRRLRNKHIFESECVQVGDDLLGRGECLLAQGGRFLRLVPDLLRCGEWCAFK